MQFITGKSSAIKIAAVSTAVMKVFPDASLLFVDVQSVVRVQPIGFNETYHGAQTRAVHALRQATCKDVFGIGIENGIIGYTDHSEDVGIVSIEQPISDPRVRTGMHTQTRGIVIPSNVIAEAERRGMGTVTIGEILSEWYGCDPKDPHSYLTNGEFSREALLREALVRLLKQVKEGVK